MSEWVERGRLDKDCCKRKIQRRMKEHPAHGMSGRRAVVALLLIVFVLCTVSHYLGFRPFGEATRLLKVGSFVLLLSTLYFFGAFDKSNDEPR
jgi:hypothetical protein